MKNIKDHLLETGCTIDNTYLDKYVELISANKERKVSKFQTQNTLQVKHDVFVFEIY